MAVNEYILQLRITCPLVGVSVTRLMHGLGLLSLHICKYFEIRILICT